MNVYEKRIIPIIPIIFADIEKLFSDINGKKAKRYILPVNAIKTPIDPKDFMKVSPSPIEVIQFSYPPPPHHASTTEDDNHIATIKKIIPKIPPKIIQSHLIALLKYATIIINKAYPPEIHKSTLKNSSAYDVAINAISKARHTVINSIKSIKNIFVFNLVDLTLFFL